LLVGGCWCCHASIVNDDPSRSSAPWVCTRCLHHAQVVRRESLPSEKLTRQ
jgi:hypothetical protein